MKRRDFFKNLIGGTAAVAIGPSLLAQVEEHDYQTAAPTPAKATPTPPKPPEQIFSNNSGLWVFQNNKMVAWSPLYELSIHFTPNYTHMQTKQEWEKDHVWDGVETLIHDPTIEFEVGDLHIIDEAPFYGDELLQIVFVNHDEKAGTIMRMNANGIWTEIGFECQLDEHIKRSARFISAGKVTSEIEAI